MADRTLVDAPVERVELFEDRAAVSRLVPALAPGRHTLVIEGVTPLAREQALVFPSAGGVVVEEARVEREQITRRAADVGDARALSERAEALEQRRDALQQQVRRHEEASARAGGRVDAAMAWVPRLLQTSAPDDALAAVRALASLRTAARVRVGEHASELEAVERELQQVQARLRAARAGKRVWTGRIVLRVQVPDGAGAFRVRYTIPCAVWRPMHRAVLRGSRVAWEVGAMAWNATGEDWSGVTLVCSTARPGGHATPPVLTDDRVQTRRRDKEVVVEAREEVIHVAREGEARRAQEVPGVDDGGEPRAFTAPYPVDLASDGRPVHVRLEEWEADAQVSWVAHPERSSQVVLRSRQNNAGSRPLLAGPVELVREAGAVGRGKVGFVAPGEPFTIGWGSHDAVRVTRKHERWTERTRITGWQSSKFQVDFKLANLGDERIEVEVRERLPVSELAEVTVTPPTANPPLDAGPDADGLCRWKLPVEPGEVRDVTLFYKVEAASAVKLPW